MNESGQLSHEELLEALNEAQAENARLTNIVATIRKCYADLFENVGDSIFIINATTYDVIDANANAARRLGFSTDELIGMSLDDIEIMDASQTAGQVSWESEFSGTQVYECHYRGKDGQLIPVEVSSRVVSRGDREVIQNIVRNISVRKQMESEREQLIADLDSFAHTVAHDLKNPLQLMLGYLSLLQTEAVELNGTSRDMLTGGITAANRMNSIINELLLLASVRKEDVEIAPVDMQPIVDQALGRLAHMLTQYEPEIILPDDWPIAVGYAPWIEEVWVNYLSNGLKYGGNPPVLQFGSDSDYRGMVRFWLKDNGKGLDLEAQTALFTEFVRLDKVQVQGHGLGLSIVRRIVEKLGGQVGVESTRDEGSLFYFTLPSVIEGPHVTK